MSEIPEFDQVANDKLVRIEGINGRLKEIHEASRLLNMEEGALMQERWGLQCDLTSPSQIDVDNTVDL